MAAAPERTVRSMIAGARRYSLNKSSQVRSSSECTSRIAPFAEAPAAAKPASLPSPTSTTSAAMPSAGVGGDQPTETRCTANGTGSSTSSRVAPSLHEIWSEYFSVCTSSTPAWRNAATPPGHGSPHCRRAGHATADLVGQPAQVFLERRPAQCVRDDLWVGLFAERCSGVGRAAGSRLVPRRQRIGLGRRDLRRCWGQGGKETNKQGSKKQRSAQEHLSQPSIAENISGTTNQSTPICGLRIIARAAL